MKKLIVIILVLIGFSAIAQTPPRTGYLVQPAKWKFVNPIWLDSGAYITKIVKTSGQNRYLVYDSLTGKVGYRFVSNIDTTSLSNRINLRVKYTDTSAMLSPYFLASDSIQWRNRVRYADTAAMLTKYLRKADTLHMTYTSPLIRQGNNLSAPSVLTSLTAGNGIITSGSTIYADTTKIASRRTPIFLTNITTPLIIGGTSTTSPLTYKTTTGVGTTGADHIFQVGNNGATEAMRILNNKRIGIGTSSPASVLDIRSTSESQGLISVISKTSGTNYGVDGTSNGVGATTNVGGIFAASGATNNYGLIVSSGNVGIGTTQPSQKLHISQDGGSGGVNILVQDVNATNAGTAYFGIYQGSPFFQAGTAGKNITFWDATTQQMTLFSGGNLTLGGTTSISKFAIPIAPTASPNYGTLSLSNTATAFNGSTPGYFVGSSSGQYIGVNSVGSVAYNFLQFSKNGSSRFKVDSLGYVKGANLYSNSYTPTLTGVTNVSSSQAYTCQYSRTDSVVTVSGTIGITATANNSRTTIGISLPVASDFTAISNAGGAAYTTGNTTAGHGAGIYADATNDRVELDYYETHGTADIFTFSFTYRIK